MSLLASLFFLAVLVGAVSLIVAMLNAQAGRIRDALLFRTDVSDEPAIPMSHQIMFRRSPARLPIAANGNISLAGLPLAA
jgi:hypothetical protein